MRAQPGTVARGGYSQRNRRYGKKMRPRSDAATDGDRLWRVIVAGGLIRRNRTLALLCYAAVTATLIHRTARRNGLKPRTPQPLRAPQNCLR